LIKRCQKHREKNAHDNFFSRRWIDRLARVRLRKFGLRWTIHTLQSAVCCLRESGVLRVLFCLGRERTFCLQAWFDRFVYFIFLRGASVERCLACEADRVATRGGEPLLPGPVCTQILEPQRLSCRCVRAGGSREHPTMRFDLTNRPRPRPRMSDLGLEWSRFCRQVSGRF
jgi:hypothetical protein